MPSCCQRPRTRSSGATGVTGRCRRRLTVCGRRGRCKGGWLWISKATNRRTAATISWRPSTTLGNDSDQPTFFATVSKKPRSGRMAQPGLLGVLADHLRGADQLGLGVPLRGGLAVRVAVRPVHRGLAVGRVVLLLGLAERQHGGLTRRHAGLGELAAVAQRGEQVLQHVLGLGVFEQRRSQHLRPVLGRAHHRRIATGLEQVVRRRGPLPLRLVRRGLGAVGSRLLARRRRLSGFPRTRLALLARGLIGRLALPLRGLPLLPLLPLPLLAGLLLPGQVRVMLPSLPLL